MKSLIKNTLLFTMFSLVVACYQYRPGKFTPILLFSKNPTEVKIDFFGDDYKPKSETLKIPIYKDYLFFASTRYKDERPYAYKVCRTANTNNDTVKIYSQNNTFGVQFDGYDPCQFETILAQDSINCPTIEEALAYLKNTNASHYYELLPNQQCIVIPLY